MTSRRESKSSEESKSSDSRRKSHKATSDSKHKEKFEKHSSKARHSDKDKRKSSSPTKDKAETQSKPKMEELSYYEILDVSPNADETEIKKAYRKNAIRWHPDKNPNNKEEAEAMFKLVAEAYEVLSNSEKREIYDRYGKDGLKPGGASQSNDFFYNFDINRAQNLFEQMFGDDPFFNRGFGGFSSFGGFEDPFFGGMGARSRNSGSRRRDPFEDFFGGGLGNLGDMGGFSQSFSSSSFGSGGGTSKTTRSFTTIVNGQRVTKTETTVRYPDGRVETTTDETTGDAQRIGDSRGSGRRLNCF